MSNLVCAQTETHFVDARNLLQEYLATLEFDLKYQNVERELSTLSSGHYAPPNGRLILAYVGDEAAGCIALRRLYTDYCEMKRLYVRPAHRGHNIGRRLVQALTDEARQIGYKFIRLDSVPRMQTALKLYESLGFRLIAPYCLNPVPEAIFLELDLETARVARP